MENGKPAKRLWTKRFTYDEWMDAQGVPVHRGYFIADLRTIELGWWQMFGCNAAFIQLTGQEGVTSTRVIEVPAGGTLDVMALSFDEIGYALDGHGLTSHTLPDGETRTFEWGPHTMFTMPRNHAAKLVNASGDRPVRLMFFNYLPMAMSTVPDPEFYFNNPIRITAGDEEDYYSEARMVAPNDAGDRAYLGKRVYWYGNLFPDMANWDKMESNAHRGAGGTSVYCQFPDSELSAHMSEFAVGTYKKAHRHGPGRAIVIPNGVGYSLMWEEGKPKEFIPWQECSLFVPPDRWFHQHFNLGDRPARYLAMHPPMQFHGHADKVTDRAKDQIEYSEEDPSIRELFEAELAKRGLSSGLDPKVYESESKLDWTRFEKDIIGTGVDQ